MSKPPEAPSKDHRRAKGMKEAKAAPEITNPAPSWRNRPPPAPPLGSGFVPVVVQPGAELAAVPLSSLQFVFYRRQWPNSLAPFCTAQEPRCGARFQESARHGRLRSDLESAQPEKWRSFYCPKP